MLTVNEAYKIAEKGINDALTHCCETDKQYIFYFDSGDGSPYITVDKRTRQKGYLPVPPLSNLDIIERAKEIDIATITK
jgi:hypothetical protein